MNPASNTASRGTKSALWDLVDPAERREHILRRALEEITAKEDQSRSDAVRLDEVERIARLALEEAYDLYRGSRL